MVVIRVLSRAPCEPRNYAGLDLRSWAVRPGCALGDSGCKVPDDAARGASTKSPSNASNAARRERSRDNLAGRLIFPTIRCAGYPGSRVINTHINTVDKLQRCNHSELTRGSLDAINALVTSGVTPVTAPLKGPPGHSTSCSGQRARFRCPLHLEQRWRRGGFV